MKRELDSELTAASEDTLELEERRPERTGLQKVRSAERSLRSLFQFVECKWVTVDRRTRPGLVIVVSKAVGLRVWTALNVDVTDQTRIVGFASGWLRALSISIDRSRQSIVLRSRRYSQLQSWLILHERCNDLLEITCDL